MPMQEQRGGESIAPTHSPPRYGTTPPPLYPRERPGTHCTWGCVDLETGIRSPVRPARSESLYRLRYPGRQLVFFTSLKRRRNRKQRRRYGMWKPRSWNCAVVLCPYSYSYRPQLTATAEIFVVYRYEVVERNLASFFTMEKFCKCSSTAYSVGLSFKNF